MKTMEQHVKPLYTNTQKQQSTFSHHFAIVCARKMYMFFLLALAFVFVFPPRTTRYKLTSGVLKCQVSVALMHLVREINKKYLIASSNQFVLLYLLIYDRLSAVCTLFWIKHLPIAAR